ncbi:MAG: hypothetical protein ACRD3P_09290 [Terriglobales bacterium]
MRNTISSILVSVLLLALLFSPTVSDGQQNSTIDEAHTKWIFDVMRIIQTIKPGMNRGDLKRVFGDEGGLSTRKQRKYVYKSCPYIKVDVTFAPVDQDPSTEQAGDKIVSISHPYLEYVIMD